MEEKLYCSKIMSSVFCLWWWLFVSSQKVYSISFLIFWPLRSTIWKWCFLTERCNSSLNHGYKISPRLTEFMVNLRENGSTTEQSLVVRFSCRRLALLCCASFNGCYCTRNTQSPWVPYPVKSSWKRPYWCCSCPSYIEPTRRLK